MTERGAFCLMVAIGAVLCAPFVAALIVGVAW